MIDAPIGIERRLENGKDPGELMTVHADSLLPGFRREQVAAARSTGVMCRGSFINPLFDGRSVCCLA
jgi:hypothetical protein